MATQKSKQKPLPVASAWPQGSLSDEEFAEWVETHSLEKLMGSGGASQKSSQRVEVRKATQKQETFERLLTALRVPQKDLQAARRIAQEKDVPYTKLLRSWIREGLKREQRRTAG